MSVFDKPRPDTPKTAAIENNVTQIHDIVLTDHQLNVREIAENRHLKR